MISEPTFKPGEIVELVRGPFRGYTGKIKEVNHEKQTLKLTVNIFGRNVPVEPRFQEVKKKNS